MSELRNLIDFRRFAEPRDLLHAVQEGQASPKADENIKSAITIMAFETSNQRNWLLFTSKRVYCLLDDRRKEKPKVRWSVPISKSSNTNIEVRDYTKDSGVIVVDADNTLLYSKRLFSDMTPIQRIDLIKSKAVAQAYEA